VIVEPLARTIGRLAAGMARQGYDLQLTRYGTEGWRATFFPRRDGALLGGRRISIESIARLCALARAVYDRRTSLSTAPNSSTR
jgi:hypothetical protein